MFSLIIDVATKDKKKLMRRLRALKSTMSCEDGGEYHEERYYSQVHLETALTEQNVDDWLYKTKGFDYVGVTERK